MKLASVNPVRRDLTLESLVSNKEMMQTSQLASVLGSSAEAPRALDMVQMGLSEQAERRLAGGGPCGFDFGSNVGNAGIDLVTSYLSPPIPNLADHMSMVQRSFDNNVSQVGLPFNPTS